jgi:hypothetical protein
MLEKVEVIFVKMLDTAVPNAGSAATATTATKPARVHPNHWGRALRAKN